MNQIFHFILSQAMPYRVHPVGLVYLVGFGLSGLSGWFGLSGLSGLFG